jgi:deoxyribodipyrimidine photo-lyase
MRDLFDDHPHEHAQPGATAAARGWAADVPPTRSAALARIGRVRPNAYARTRNHLDGAVTGLSPYLTHGLVTLREVLQGVAPREPLQVQHKLVFELGWREYFRHVWAHQGDAILRSLHAGPLPDEAYEPELPADIREARTGLPVIDEAVRTLYATGTLHNHARMWLASYVVHLRHVHWRAGADWLVAHLLDGDLASNHLSWQWVAGTGSHKPYLFNAGNIERYAPEAWHSRGSLLDVPYETMDRHAHAARAAAGPGPASLAGTPEPALWFAPPPGLGLARPDADAAQRLQGREVWLVHPWALRAPPADLPDKVLRLGLCIAEHHEAWPWPEARWRWVDAAMGAVTDERWFVGIDELATLVASATRVRSVDDPHLTRWLKRVARLDHAPMLFPLVARRCDSFSQWWSRATAGLVRATELL